MKRTAATGLLLATLLSPASAGYWTYSQLALEQPADQTMYIVGAVDALSLSDTKIMECVHKLSFKAGEMRANIMAFAASKPAVHASTVTVAVYAYLQEACPQLKK